MAFEHENGRDHDHIHGHDNNTHDHFPVPTPFDCYCPVVPRKKRNKHTLSGRLPDTPVFPRGTHGLHKCPPCNPGTRVPFADLRLHIYNLTPIPGTDGALNEAALTVSSLGVLITLLAWLDQAEGDHVTLMLNGFPATYYTVTEDDALIGKHVTLAIESDKFRDQANNTVQAVVVPLDGDPVSTAVFTLWVDRKLPVGVDPIVSTPTVNENMQGITFVDPFIEASGRITETAAQLGVQILIGNYPVNSAVSPVHHRKEGDVIWISIGGVLIFHIVTNFEASGTAPIIIIVSHGTWLLVPPGMNIIEWFVRDKAGNQSPGFSPPRLIQNNTGGGTEPLLQQGHVLESMYDPDLDQDYINGDELSEHLKFEVLIKNHGWLARDKILVTYLGLTMTGGSESHTETYEVLQPNQSRAYIPLSLDFVKKLAGGRLLVSYERIRAGQPNTPSHAVMYFVRGEPVDNRLPAPVIHDLKDGALPIDTDPVHITVLSSGVSPGDKVDLIIEGKTLSGKNVYAQYTEIGGDADIDLYLNYTPFEELEGATATAYYLINNDASAPSKSVTFPVGNISVGLSPPRSPQAAPPGHVFDELVSKGNLSALVDPNSAIALNDQVRMVATGSKPGGSTTTAWLNVSAVWFGSVLTFTIPRTIVLANRDGTMSLHWEVRTPPSDVSLKSMPLVVKVGAQLQLTECPSLLEATLVSPCRRQLDPLNVWTPQPRILTFRVQYAMLPGDLVTIKVLGKPGLGMPAIPGKPGIPDAGEPFISFPYSSNLIAAYLGESFIVYFEVLRDITTIQSPYLTVDVESLSESTLDLVSIPEALDGEVDSSKPAHGVLEAWPFLNRNQDVFIDLISSKLHSLRMGTKVSAAEFTNKRTQDLIPVSYLNGLNNGDELTIEAAVSFDESGSRTTAISLKPASYIVRHKAAIVKTILVGTNPFDIGITPDGKKLFVGCSSSQDVHVIDAALQKVVATISVAVIQGMEISRDGTRLLTSRAGSATSAHYVYSTASYAYLGHMSSNYWTQDVTVNGDDSKAYYAEYSYQGGGYVYSIGIYQTPANTFYNRVSMPISIYPRAIKPSPDSSIALVLHSYSTYLTVFRLNLRTDKFLSNSPTFGSLVTDVAFESNGSRAFCATATQVTGFDYVNNVITGTLSGFTSATKITCHPYLDRAYVSDSPINTVVVLDTRGDIPVVVDRLTGFNSPSSLVVSPDGQFLYVNNVGAGSVSIVKL